MKRTKKSMFRAGLAFALSLSLSLSLMITPVSAELEDLTDTGIYECVGELTENFDELETLDALYNHVEGGVLSGTWRLTQWNQWGAGTNTLIDNDEGKVLQATAGDNGLPGGVDFVFDTPLSPEYVLDISYDMHFDNSTAAPEALLSNGIFDDQNQTMGLGRRMGNNDSSFQIFTNNGDNNGAQSVIWQPVDSGTLTVKGIYNLTTWTYSAEIYQKGIKVNGVTDVTIGPAHYDTGICVTDSSYEKISFINYFDTAWFDNISVKAYKLKSDIEPHMEETFTGKTAGAMTNTKVESGFGSWVANTAWGGGYQYAAYIDSEGQNNIGIKADGAWSRLQYMPGINFSKFYKNNTGEITFGFDFITPDTVADGKMIMEWGDGFTNKYRNIPFFAITKADDEHYSFTRCAKNSGESGSADIWPDFGAVPFVLLDKSTAYTFEGKVYPASGMTYATVKQGENVIYSGFYRMEQWRMWTEGLNLHTMSVSEVGSAATGIIFDNFKMSAREFTVQEPLGKTLDFNEFSNNGFLETIYWGAAKIAPAPSNGETDMGNALNVVGDSEGVALPYFAEPVTEGIYRYTAMLYNKNLDVAEDESEGKKNSRSRVMIDAPKDSAGFIGSLTLALLENNTVSLGKEDKIAVAPNEWIGVETIIDLNNKKTYLAVYDKDGTRLGVVSVDFFANDSTEETQYTIDSLSSIRIRNWNSNTSIDSVIDNMKLEQLNGSIGFTKDNNAINSAAAGDNLGLSFILTDTPDAASSETCIIAYYDANGNQLISVDMPTFTMNPDSIFCICDGITTVPTGAVTAKAFIWDISTLKPLAESAVLSIVSAE